MATKSYKVKGKDIGNMMITMALLNIFWKRVNQEIDDFVVQFFYRRRSRVEERSYKIFAVNKDIIILCLLVDN